MVVMEKTIYLQKQIKMLLKTERWFIFKSHLNYKDFLAKFFYGKNLFIYTHIQMPMRERTEDVLKKKSNIL